MWQVTKEDCSCVVVAVLQFFVEENMKSYTATQPNTQKAPDPNRTHFSIHHHNETQSRSLRSRAAAKMPSSARPQRATVLGTAWVRRREVLCLQDLPTLHTPEAKYPNTQPFNPMLETLTCTCMHFMRTCAYNALCGAYLSHVSAMRSKHWSSDTTEVCSKYSPFRADLGHRVGRVTSQLGIALYTEIPCDAHCRHLGFRFGDARRPH